MGGEALRRRNRSSRSSFPVEQSAKKTSEKLAKKSGKCITRTVLQPSSVKFECSSTVKRGGARIKKNIQLVARLTGETNANKRDCSHCLGRVAIFRNRRLVAIAEVAL